MYFMPPIFLKKFSNSFSHPKTFCVPNATILFIGKPPRWKYDSSLKMIFLTKFSSTCWFSSSQPKNAVLFKWSSDFSSWFSWIFSWCYFVVYRSNFRKATCLLKKGHQQNAVKPAQKMARYLNPAFLLWHPI